MLDPIPSSLELYPAGGHLACASTVLLKRQPLSFSKPRPVGRRLKKFKPTFLMHMQLKTEVRLRRTTVRFYRQESICFRWNRKLRLRRLRQSLIVRNSLLTQSNRWRFDRQKSEHFCMTKKVPFFGDHFAGTKSEGFRCCISRSVSVLMIVVRTPDPPSTFSWWRMST